MDILELSQEVSFFYVSLFCALYSYCRFSDISLKTNLNKYKILRTVEDLKQFTDNFEMKLASENLKQKLRIHYLSEKTKGLIPTIYSYNYKHGKVFVIIKQWKIKNTIY